MSSSWMGSVRNIHGLALLGLSVSAALAQTAASRIVNAAHTFVSTLDEKQRLKVLFPCKPELLAARFRDGETNADGWA
jgi:hypothetical protein